MIATQNCWLLLEKSDETRISKSISSYNDKTGEEYNYDSLVPNHKNVQSDDLAIIRKENKILGYGVVGDIKQQNAIKKHKRCPACNATDVRARDTLSPRWKCGRCRHEFAEPVETEVSVVQYKAAIRSFVRFENPPDVRLVKACAVGAGPNSQLSILALDSEKLKAIIGEVELLPSHQRAVQSSQGQGIGLSPAERRAVEAHAMSLAFAHYKAMGWEVVDKSAFGPYDLMAVKADQKRFIEVKGTTGAGLSVLLTHGEVKHAMEHITDSVLVVVANIKLARENDRWVTSGGEIVCHQSPWVITKESLLPTQFRYAIPREQNGKGMQIGEA